MNWVEKLIVAMEGSVGGILKIKVDNQVVQALIQPEVIAFFKTNHAVLYKMGKQSFLDFLGLLQQNKRDEAFHLILQSMDAEDIIARMEMDTEELKEWNENRERFNAALQDFALNVLAPSLIKVLTGLIV